MALATASAVKGPVFRLSILMSPYVYQKIDEITGKANYSLLKRFTVTMVAGFPVF